MDFAVNDIKAGSCEFVSVSNFLGSELGLYPARYSHSRWHTVWWTIINASDKPVSVGGSLERLTKKLPL